MQQVVCFIPDLDQVWHSGMNLWAESSPHFFSPLVNEIVRLLVYTILNGRGTDKFKCIFLYNVFERGWTSACQLKTQYKDSLHVTLTVFYDGDIDWRSASHDGRLDDGIHGHGYTISDDNTDLISDNMLSFWSTPCNPHFIEPRCSR